ncbi:MAG TPA: hypothetical protein VHC22_23405 [Pirellulales bacterium]|nr:hypothetical protein [Pirellulales bacterium]
MVAAAITPRAADKTRKPERGGKKSAVKRRFSEARAGFVGCSEFFTAPIAHDQPDKTSRAAILGVMFFAPRLWRGLMARGSFSHLFSAQQGPKMLLNDDDVRAVSPFSCGARLAATYVAALMAFGFGLMVSFKLGTANAAAPGAVIVSFCALYLTIFSGILLFRTRRMHQERVCRKM